MEKKLLIFRLFVLVAAMSCAFATSEAYDFEVDGIYYIRNGSKPQVMTTHKSSTESGYSGDVNIPSTVTYGSTTYTVIAVGEFTFQGATGVTSVTIPNTVTAIGRLAFSGCSGLTNLTIPNSVTFIGEAAFYNCSSMRSITIGSSVTTISANAFRNCEDLYGMLIFATTPPTVADDTFQQANYWDTRLTVPRGCMNAYRSASGWSSFDYIKEVPYDFIVDNIYYAITGSNTVKVTHSGFNYYAAAYSGSLNIPSSVSYGGKTYQVTAIDDFACEYSTALTSVTIPPTVTVIGSYAFRECSALTSFTIPSSVMTIGSNAFTECSALARVTIGSSVTSIGEGAFSLCSELMSVTSLASTPPTMASSYVFDSKTYNSAMLYVRTGCASVYGSTNYWNKFTSISEVYTLDDALNVAGGNISFDSSGDYPWITENESGRIYAKSGNTGVPSSSSVLTATVTVNNLSTLSFDFKAWGEGTSYDKCIFSIDGTQQFSYGARDNNWETFTAQLTAGIHTLTWTYQKDSSVNPTGDYFAVDNVTLRRPLDPALNVAGGTIHFTSEGTYPWIVKEDGGRDYAQSSNASVSSSSSVLTATVTVNNLSTLSFDFKAWGEGTSYDKCIFSIDGTQQFSYGARDNDWETFTAQLTAGTHTLTWTYQKDSSVNPTGDYFAVDNVAITENGAHGDVNGDTYVTIADVSALIDILLGKGEVTAGSDVNGDTYVTIADVSALIDILLVTN